MSLLTCTDCHQPVSSEAVMCLGCGRPMRDRSYLTPWAQMAVGALVLIACFAWPPMIFILGLVVLGRYLERARQRSTRSLIVAAGVLIALSVALMYVVPVFTLVVLVLSLAALAWLASSRVGAKRMLTQDPPI
jgi:hypothetical protein